MSKIFIQQQLKNILTDLDLLKILVKNNPYEELVTNEEKLSLAERRLERILNRAIHLNLHLIRSQKKSPPDDYTTSFLKLGELKIISSKLAQNLAPAAGARNQLIHTYDNLDTQQFYSSLQDAIKLFPQYIKAIQRFIDK